MPDRVLPGLFRETAASSDHPRPDLWVWTLLPAFGCVGSVLVLAFSVAGDVLFGVYVGLWVWAVALALPLGLYLSDVLSYHLARRRGRRAGWRLRALAADEAGEWLIGQRQALASGTAYVAPADAGEQRYARLNANGQTRGLLPMNAEARAKWLVSPGGKRAETEAVYAFLKRAYRVRNVGRRAHVPDAMTRAEYDAVTGFLIDCGLIEDSGPAGRRLVYPTLAEAEGCLWAD